MRNIETIVDDNQIELLVTYNYEKADKEDEGIWLTELVSVELIIATRGIELLGILHPEEKEKIISLLTYEK